MLISTYNEKAVVFIDCEGNSVLFKDAKLAERILEQKWIWNAELILAALDGSRSKTSSGEMANAFRVYKSRYFHENREINFEEAVGILERVLERGDFSGFKRDIDLDSLAAKKMLIKQYREKQNGN